MKLIRVDRQTATPAGPLLSLFRANLQTVAALALMLVAGVPPAFGGLLPDARNVPVPLEVVGASVSVRIPAGAASCLLEVKLPNSRRWYRWRTLLPAGKPALSTVPISKSLQGAEWRATANVSASKAALFAKTHKFPEAYYQGPAKFAMTPAAGHAAGYVASAPLSLRPSSPPRQPAVASVWWATTARSCPSRFSTGMAAPSRRP